MALGGAVRCGRTAGEGWDGEGGACVKGLDGQTLTLFLSIKAPHLHLQGRKRGSPLREGLTSQGVWEPPFSGESTLSPTR